MTTFSLSPLFRQTVGFDRFNDLFESAFRADASAPTYPPYNIERLGEDDYAITMALAGFKESDLEITAEGNQLKVAGRIQEKANEEGKSYLYRGIATRNFERTFSLADHVRVEDASLSDGLLRIQLKREIPEAQKPRMIPIKGLATAVSHKKAN